MPPNSLPALPAAIIDEIQHLLNYGSRLALRLTSRDLYTKVNNSDTSPSESTTCLNAPDPESYELHSLSTTSDHNPNPSAPPTTPEPRPLGCRQALHRQDSFVCCRCLKRRSVSKFSDVHVVVKGKCGKVGLMNTTKRIGRYCIPVGVAQGRYGKGVHLSFGGTCGWTGFVC